MYPGYTLCERQKKILFEIGKLIFEIRKQVLCKHLWWANRTFKVKFMIRIELWKYKKGMHKSFYILLYIMEHSTLLTTMKHLKRKYMKFKLWSCKNSYAFLYSQRSNAYLIGLWQWCWFWTRKHWNEGLYSNSSYANTIQVLHCRIVQSNAAYRRTDIPLCSAAILNAGECLKPG